MTAKSKEPSKGGLTIKQEKFLNHCWEHGSPIDAYRFAFNAEKMSANAISVAANKLMHHPKIALRLTDLKAKSETKAVMTRTQALERLSLIASTNLTDIVEFKTHEVETADGPVEQTIWRIKESEELQEVAAVSIKSVTMTKLGPRIEMHDKLSAIQQLAKLQGWESAQKFELTGKDGGPIETNLTATLDASKLSSAALKEIIEASKGEANQG